MKTAFLIVASMLALLQGHASATLITKLNSTTGVFDPSIGTSSGTRAFTFTVDESGGVITDVDISIQFGKHDGETFGTNAGGTPFYNEIIFMLTGNVVGADPTATLVGGGSWGSGSDGFTDLTINFDESAGSVVNFDIPGGPVAGTFRTTGNAGGLGLSQFNGKTLEAGTWTLYIEDAVGADALDFISAKLNVTVESSSVADTGATASLMGLAMLGLAAVRRKLGSEILL